MPPGQAVTNVKGAMPMERTDVPSLSAEALARLDRVATRILRERGYGYVVPVDDEIEPVSK